jgi:alpha-L-rhamnosidase
MRRIIPLLLMAALFAACGNKVEITNLTVEMQDGSMPLATATPRFSWNYEATVDNVMQTSYHIIVASSEEKARRGEGDLWDSQTVDTSQMLYIPYAGTPLKSRDRCWWRVYTTVTYGAPASRRHEETLESPIQYFELSLLDRNDWHARWIGRDYEDDKIEGHTEVPARYLRHEFQLRNDIDHARLYISGLGQYQAFFNGQEVAEDELLKPALSDYTRRVTCSYNSVSGRIESNWRRKGDVFEWDILIPPNRTAEVWLPTADGYELLKLGSGRHHFTI